MRGEEYFTPRNKRVAKWDTSLDKRFFASMFMTNCQKSPLSEREKRCSQGPLPQNIPWHLIICIWFLAIFAQKIARFFSLKPTKKDDFSSLREAV